MEAGRGAGSVRHGRDSLGQATGNSKFVLCLRGDASDGDDDGDGNDEMRLSWSRLNELTNAMP